MTEMPFVPADAVCLEGITSVSACINACIAGDGRREIYTVLFDEAKINSERRRYTFLSNAARKLGFPLFTIPSDKISELASGRTHGGILASVSPAIYREPLLSDIGQNDFAVIIDGIEDPYSLGYSLRSLYAAGADAVILPRRNFGTSDATLVKASAGTSELLKVFCADDMPAVASIYAKQGFTVAAAGIRDSVPYTQATLRRPLLLVFGGEKRGISALLMHECSLTVRIPYGRNFMGSLSSAAAISVLAFEVLRQNVSDADSALT